MPRTMGEHFAAHTDPITSTPVLPPHSRLERRFLLSLIYDTGSVSVRPDQMDGSSR